ncbi:MAG: NusG domain II-containing protein [Eubacteriales bacterium]|nr:NusG domain II-containing protein [Eubacteriales bacterium]
MNKKDLWLILGFIMLAGVCYILFGRTRLGNQVVIVLDGKEYGTYSLDQNQDIMVKGEKGYNQVRIEDCMVWIVDADCPDRYCVKQGKTNDRHKSLICLPHELVVEVKSSDQGMPDEDDVDMISQ